VRAAIIALMLAGCGASASDHAFTAVAGACDHAEERIVEAGGEDAPGRLACVRLVCDEALTRIDPSAAEELR
jgi:hypothetical protein